MFNSSIIFISGFSIVKYIIRLIYIIIVGIIINVGFITLTTAAITNIINNTIKGKYFLLYPFLILDNITIVIAIKYKTAIT